MRMRMRVRMCVGSSEVVGGKEQTAKSARACSLERSFMLLSDMSAVGMLLPWLGLVYGVCGVVCGVWVERTIEPVLDRDKQGIKVLCPLCDGFPIELRVNKVFEMERACFYLFIIFSSSFFSGRGRE
eukprot:TRINITY_DN328_c0_g2_i7.p2 TRINITY_DN328_c0_g2~~TRINITY_DN328_c0_g2_i7.p2  ORF type:complete len:127 (+),score=12.68 TRINITY_DN328_c0_g2_i7:595-975(+)